MAIEEQRKAIIEDASRKEFEAAFNFKPTEFVKFDSEYEIHGKVVGRYVGRNRLTEDYGDGPEEVSFCALNSTANTMNARWEGWQAARNQSNNVPVALRFISNDFKSPWEDYRAELSEALINAGYRVELAYTSPQHSNALEMALNIAQTLHAPSIANQGEKHMWDQAVLEYWKAIRALIAQPESDGK